MKPGKCEIKSRIRALQVLNAFEAGRCAEIGPYVWRCCQTAGPGVSARFERCDDVDYQHAATSLADIVMAPEIAGVMIIRALATDGGDGQAPGASGTPKRTPFKVLGEPNRRIRLSVAERIRRQVDMRVVDVERQLAALDIRRTALLKEREELQSIRGGLGA